MTVAEPPVDIGTLITTTPGVYGGRPCIRGTRMPVMQIAVLFNEGLSAAEISRRWGQDLVGVHAAIAYYLSNKLAIDDDLEDERLFYLRESGQESAEPTAW